MKLANVNYTLTELLLAKISDSSALNAWLQTKDAVDGLNRPESLFELLITGETRKSEVIAFENPEDFLKAFKDIAER